MRQEEQYGQEMALGNAEDPPGASRCHSDRGRLAPGTL